MKKIILLLIPAVICMSSCAKSNAPSFERYDDVVSFETFKAAVDEAKFSEYVSFVSSTKGKVYYGTDYTFKSTIGDVSITSEEGKDEREITFGFDATNNRSSIKEKGEASYIATGAEVDEQRVSKTTTSFQYQFNDKLNSFIYIDLKEKTYKKYANKNVTDSILYLIDDDYVICQSLFKQYESIVDEYKTRYGFYIDGKVFTMTYKYTDEKDLISGETSEVVAKTKATYDYLFQFGVDEGKFHFKSKLTLVNENVYATNYLSHIKDEIDHISTTNSCSLEIGPSSSTIKEIDISNYASLDKDPNGGIA